MGSFAEFQPRGPPHPQTRQLLVLQPPWTSHPRLGAATSCLAQPGPMPLCALRADAECGGLRAHAGRGPRPRAPHYASGKQRLHPQGVGAAGQVAPGHRGPGQLACPPHRAQSAPGPTVPGVHGGRGSVAHEEGTGLGGCSSGTWSPAREGP